MEHSICKDFVRGEKMQMRWRRCSSSCSCGHESLNVIRSFRKSPFYGELPHSIGEYHCGGRGTIRFLARCAWMTGNSEVAPKRGYFRIGDDTTGMAKAVRSISRLSSATSDLMRPISVHLPHRATSWSTA
jgi:hypothetical protein